MTTTTSKTHTTVTTTENNGATSTPSIRSIIRGGILAGTAKEIMKAEVVLHHPNSAAALKFAKHLAWYRATMKKAGELPVVVEVNDSAE